MLPGDVLAASSRRGDIYLIDKPFSDDPKEVKFTKFAAACTRCSAWPTATAGSTPPSAAR